KRGDANSIGLCLYVPTARLISPGPIGQEGGIPMRSIAVEANAGPARPASGSGSRRCRHCASAGPRRWADTALANPPASMTAVSSLDEQEPRETICVHCRKRNISAERESLTSHRRDRSFPLSDAEQILPCQVRALPHFFRGAGGAQHLPILITPQHAEDLRELETIDGTRKNPFELRPQV